MATGLWLTATLKFWPKCLFPEIVPDKPMQPLVGHSRQSIYTIVGMNEWIKGFPIVSYKFLHQQNNPIGKLQCIWNSYLWRGLFSAPLHIFFFNHLCSTWCFLIFCLNQGVKSTEAFSRTWKTSIVLRKFHLYVVCVW